MILYDAIVTFSLSFIIFFIMGAVVNLLLKLTSKNHWFNTTLVSLGFAVIFTLLFTIWYW